MHSAVSPITSTSKFKTDLLRQIKWLSGFQVIRLRVPNDDVCDTNVLTRFSVHPQGRQLVKILFV